VAEDQALLSLVVEHGPPQLRPLLQAHLLLEHSKVGGITEDAVENFKGKKN